MRSLIATLLIALAAALALGGAQSGAMNTASGFAGATSFPANNPADVAAGPDGALWIAEGDESYNDGIGRMTTDGTSYVHYALPGSKPHPTDPPTREPTSITAGPDGALWFTEYGLAGSGWAGVNGHRIGRITTAGGITEYPLPSGERAPATITAGPDGALWFSEYSDSGVPGIGRITTGGSIAIFRLPAGTVVRDMTGGGDGGVWFTDSQNSRIGRISSNGTITWHTVPNGGSPYGIVTLDRIWFTEPDRNLIAEMGWDGTIREEHQMPDVQDQPLWLTVGADGALWFTGVVTPNAAAIGRMTNGLNGGQGGSDGELDKYPLAGNVVDASAIALGPDEALWIPDSRTTGGLLYRFDPRAVATPPVIVEAPWVSLSPLSFPARTVRVGDLLYAHGFWSGTPPITAAGDEWQRGAGYPVGVLPDSPVAFWRLGETSGGTADDLSGNGEPGTYSSGVSLGQGGAVTGDFAAGFDGVDDRVDVPALNIASGPFSLEIWAYVRSGSGWKTLLGFDRYHRLLVSASSGALLTQFDGDFYATTYLTRAAWHHVVYTFDGKTERFYVDGQPAGSHATGAARWPSAFSIGAYDQSSNYMFNGYLDEVAVYKTALSPARIQAHYAARNLTGYSAIGPTIPYGYIPTTGDIGYTLRVVLTATNPFGSASATSNPTKPVTN